VVITKKMGKLVSGFYRLARVANDISKVASQKDCPENKKQGHKAERSLERFGSFPFRKEG